MCVLTVSLFNLISEDTVYIMYIYNINKSYIEFGTKLFDSKLSEARRTEDPEFEDSIRALWDKVHLPGDPTWLGNPPKKWGLMRFR